MLMALYYRLTPREGVGSMADIRCTGPNGLKEAKLPLRSLLAHSTMAALKGQEPSAPPALFIFSSSRRGGLGQLKWCILMAIY